MSRPLRRSIDKWLKAGVMEEGRLSRSKFSTPQGGVVSPLLANIFLHHVFDVWFENEVKPPLRGKSFMVRYADDIVIFIQNEDKAQRVMEVIPKRLGRFGLTVHPDKSRIVRFRQPKFTWRPGDGDDFQPPRTFDFLGFPLLGKHFEKRIDNEAQDCQGPPSACLEFCQSMVPRKSTRVGRRSA